MRFTKALRGFWTDTGTYELQGRKGQNLLGYALMMACERL